MLPFFLVLFIIFIIWFRYEYKKGMKGSSDSLNAFLEKEKRSNLVPKADISDLPYISVPSECLTFHDTSDEELIEYEKHFHDLSEKKILNLTGITNTDLKFKYGTGNLPLLTEYDNNYTDLARSIVKYGRSLYNNGFIEDAKKVLLFGINIHTDVSANYTLLASIYKEENNEAGITKVIDAANALASMTKDSLLNSLYDILGKYPEESNFHI